MKISTKEKEELKNRLNNLPNRYKMFKQIARHTGYSHNSILQCRVPSQDVSRQMYDTIIKYLDSISTVVERPAKIQKTINIERQQFSKVIINFTDGTVEIIK